MFRNVGELIALGFDLTTNVLTSIHDSVIAVGWRGAVAIVVTYCRRTTPKQIGRCICSTLHPDGDYCPTI